MPRLSGFKDRVDRPFPREVEYLKAGSKLTKQGVRDLNGPHMNGRSYNGRRDVTCPHHKNPHHPTTRERRLKIVHDVIADAPVEKMVDVYLCVGCGQERFDGEGR